MEDNQIQLVKMYHKETIEAIVKRILDLEIDISAQLDRRCSHLDSKQQSEKLKNCWIKGVDLWPNETEEKLRP